MMSDEPARPGAAIDHDDAPEAGKPMDSGEILGVDPNFRGEPRNPSGDGDRVDESRTAFTPSAAVRERIERWNTAMKAADAEWTSDEPPPGFRWECYATAGREEANKEQRDLILENNRLNREKTEGDDKRAKSRQETGRLRHAFNRELATLDAPPATSWPPPTSRRR